MSQYDDYDDDDGSFMGRGLVSCFEWLREKHDQTATSDGPASIGNKSCTGCGATYTAARFSDTCLKCS